MGAEDTGVGEAMVAATAGDTMVAMEVTMVVVEVTNTEEGMGRRLSS